MEKRNIPQFKKKCIIHLVYRRKLAIASGSPNPIHSDGISGAAH
jgi:hypothetical protein